MILFCIFCLKNYFLSIINHLIQFIMNVEKNVFQTTVKTSTVSKRHDINQREQKNKSLSKREETIKKKLDFNLSYDTVSGKIYGKRGNLNGYSLRVLKEKDIKGRFILRVVSVNHNKRVIELAPVIYRYQGKISEILEDDTVVVTPYSRSINEVVAGKASQVPNSDLAIVINANLLPDNAVYLGGEVTVLHERVGQTIKTMVFPL